MAEGLSVPVNAPGLAETSAGFDRLDKSASAGAGAMVKASASTGKMGASMESLQRKMMSGAVIRNAASGFAILALSAGGTSDKIAAIGFALSSIPGPWGRVAALVGAAATIWGEYAKSAEKARKEVENLTKALAEMSKERMTAIDGLADRITSAATRIGRSLREAASMGVDAKDASGVMDLAGGDPNKALGFAGQLASSGLSSVNQDMVTGRLRTAAAAGVEVTGDVLAQAIAGEKYRLAADMGTQEDIDQARMAQEAASLRGGGGLFPGSYNFGKVRELPGETGMIADIIGGDRSTANDRINRTMGVNSRLMNLALSSAEAPGIASGNRTFTDATMGLSSLGIEALGKSTDDNTNSTNKLTASIIELDKEIKNQKGKIQAATPAKGYTGWSWFAPSEPATSP